MFAQTCKYTKKADEFYILKWWILGHMDFILIKKINKDNQLLVWQGIYKAAWVIKNTTWMAGGREGKRDELSPAPINLWTARACLLNMCHFQLESFGAK